MRPVEPVRGRQVICGVDELATCCNGSRQSRLTRSRESMAYAQSMDGHGLYPHGSSAKCDHDIHASTNLQRRQHEGRNRTVLASILRVTTVRLWSPPGDCGSEPCLRRETKECHYVGNSGETERCPCPTGADQGYRMAMAVSSDQSNRQGSVQMDAELLQMPGS